MCGGIELMQVNQLNVPQFLYLCLVLPQNLLPPSSIHEHLSQGHTLPLRRRQKS